jgi:hypothetical protein
VQYGTLKSGNTNQRFGITSESPGRIMVPEIPLAFRIAETEEWLRLAMADKLSPFLTM